MSTFQLKTPIAFFIFNRPETTKVVFEEIRKAKPPQLFVIADGPRRNSPDDVENCKSARAVIDSIDWSCKLIKNYSDINLGCKNRVSSGLDWVFDNAEEAIILEDDCLPHPTFFRFCEELLDKYRIDERIMMISGDNFQFGRNHSQYSYYFSRYSHIWGWASWRRAWKHYDVNMNSWSTVRNGTKLNDCLGDRKVVSYWMQHFEKTYKGEIDTWDYQWTFACWMQNALNVLPSVNLVSNIGFTHNATHTDSKSPFSNMAVEPISFPLYHPPSVVRNDRADDFTQKTHYNPGILKRVKYKLINLGLLAR